VSDSCVPEDLPLIRGASLLEAHPAGLLALEKPAGVLSHPNRRGERKAKTLLRAEYDPSAECYEWTGDDGRERRLHLVHRLDSPTSGVILACLSDELAQIVRQAFAERKARKNYYALVREKAKGRDGLWKDKLEESRRGGKLRVLSGRGTEALTKASFERRRIGRLGLSLVRLRPITGRTHQLRVQCAVRGLPIVGDRTYGDFSFNRRASRSSGVDRLCLHASGIDVEVPHQGKTIFFSAESPVPRSFGKLMS